MTNILLQFLLATVLNVGASGFVSKNTVEIGASPSRVFQTVIAMTWKFTEQSSRTSVEVTYAVSGYQPQGFQQLAPAVDGVMAEQLQRLKVFVETGHADSKQ